MKAKKNNLKILFNNQFFRTLLAIILGFIVAGIMLLTMGHNPLAVYSTMFTGVFKNPRNIAETIIKATPLIITGSSIAFAFKTGLFNIGSEGQYTMGFVFAGMVGILLDLPWFLQIPIVILAGMLGGLLLGGLSGILKSKFGVHEVISGIMLNWISLYFLNYIALGSPFFVQETSGTDSINVSGQIKLFAAEKAAGDYSSITEVPIIGRVLARSDLNYGILIAIFVAILLHFIIKKSTLGYQLKAVGFNKDAAEFAGIDVNKNIIRSLAIAGIISGLAGAVNIMSLSPHKITSLAMFENYGFDGLSVALIAGSSLIGVIPSALLFAVFKIGGSVIQQQYQISSEIISILIGVIIFFIALSSILPIIADYIASKKTKEKL
ncbi:ABC transporter permease [Helcococcus sueciensis]|uniref:ABC transporter permease n=1 Tax=Helcococcus sueciensis TaxID=241555 RepID=UPI0004219932|nr:ABC transporter permease [Helcococcus sueciensis]